MLETKDFITGGASIVAALASVWNAWKQYRDDKDSLVVEFGDPAANYQDQDVMQVFNRGKQAIVLADYGFIDPEGHLTSIPDFHAAVGAIAGDFSQLLRDKRIEPREHDLARMQISRVRGQHWGEYVHGAYARIMGQSRPVICFCPGVSRRAKLRTTFRYRGFFPTVRVLLAWWA